MDVSSLKVDTTKENEGVWHNYRDGSKVRIAAFSSTSFQRYFDSLRKPSQKARDMGIVDPEAETDLLCKAMARCILLDWDGFLQDGKTLPYSEKAAFELLRGSPLLRNHMAAFAQSEDAYRAEQDGAIEKNLSTSSAGGSESGPSGGNS